MSIIIRSSDVEVPVNVPVAKETPPIDYHYRMAQLVSAICWGTLNSLTQAASHLHVKIRK